MKWSLLALLVAGVAVILLLIGGPGTRLGLWDFGFGFQLMRYALYAGIAGASLALVLLIIPATRKGSAFMLILAMITSLVVITVPLQLRDTARSVPFIHDITTDTSNPPQFVAVLPLRADAPNPPEYAGAGVAAQQLEAYPDIQTRAFERSTDEVFQAALAAAEAQPWDIIDVAAADGRIEAVETTLWYGFKDDVVIRIEPTPGGSKLDVRSKSRIGGSDLGANAARIREFLASLEQQLD